MNTERVEVFRGHIDECLRHLAARIAASAPKGSRGAARSKQPIADFCGVALSSVTRWLHKGELPIGEPLVRLLCCFDAMGYRVIELEHMPKTRRNFFELVGYGLLSPEQAARLLSYVQTSTLLRMILGRCGASGEKEEIMWRAWKERRAELEAKKEEAQKKLGYLDSSPGACPPAGALSMSDRPVSVPLPQAVISIMKILLTWLEEEKSFSGGELAELKSSAGEILCLAARLSSLHSRLILTVKEGD